MDSKMKYNNEYEVIVKMQMNDDVDEQKVKDYIKFALEKSKKMKNVNVTSIVPIDERYNMLQKMIEKEIF